MPPTGTAGRRDERARRARLRVRLSGERVGAPPQRGWLGGRTRRHLRGLRLRGSWPPARTAEGRVGTGALRRFAPEVLLRRSGAAQVGEHSRPEAGPGLDGGGGRGGGEARRPSGAGTLRGPPGCARPRGRRGLRGDRADRSRAGARSRRAASRGLPVPALAAQGRRGRPVRCGGARRWGHQDAEHVRSVRGVLRGREG